MERAGVHPGEIDLIVLGTASPDRLLPSAAVDLQAALGASRAAALDVGAACSGFIYGCTVAEGMMATTGAETVLVVGDSNLQIYQYKTENLRATGEHAGFTAHLARHLGLPVSLSATGGLRLAQLGREPELFEARRVVLFVGATWVLSAMPWTAITE
jgi:hypothetical protein